MGPINSVVVIYEPRMMSKMEKSVEVGARTARETENTPSPKSICLIQFRVFLLSVTK